VLTGLRDSGGRASTLTQSGRRIARLRSDAWSLVRDATEVLYSATVASYFFPPELKDVSCALFTFFHHKERDKDRGERVCFWFLWYWWCLSDLWRVLCAMCSWCGQLGERFEFLLRMLRQCTDRVQEALERTFRLPEGAQAGSTADPLLFDRWGDWPWRLVLRSFGM
jgi:hypothetical protein